MHAGAPETSIMHAHFLCYLICRPSLRPSQLKSPSRPVTYAIAISVTRLCLELSTSSLRVLCALDQQERTEHGVICLVHAVCCLALGLGYSSSSSFSVQKGPSSYIISPLSDCLKGSIRVTSSPAARPPPTAMPTNSVLGFMIQESETLTPTNRVRAEWKEDLHSSRMARFVRQQGHAT